MLTINNKLLRIGNTGFANWTPPPPFDVVSDSDFNQNLQLTYDSIPDYNSRYKITSDP